MQEEEKEARAAYSRPRSHIITTDLIIIGGEGAVAVAAVVFRGYLAVRTVQGGRRDHSTCSWAVAVAVRTCSHAHLVSNPLALPTHIRSRAATLRAPVREAVHILDTRCTAGNAA